MLAILLLRHGEAVSTDRLIDELWGERPPATAAKTLQVYVSHLRKALGENVIDTRGRAYALAVEHGQVDVERFEGLAAEGREALGEGDAARAADRLREALALWRGPALADFAYEPFAQAESARLEEARLGALEDRIEADLARGVQASLCPELEALVDEHPTRERFQGQLMLALYRSGRQAEALERYGAARRALQDELGIEPGRELQELQRRILDQDPALDAPAPPGPLARVTGTSRLRRGALVAVVGGVLLLGGALGVILSQSDDDPGVVLVANSVGVLDEASGELEASIPVGARPREIAAGEGAVWVANIDDGSVSKIDPESEAVVGTTVPGGAIHGLAAGEGGIWVSDVRQGTVAKMDPDFRRVVGRVDVAPGSVAPRPFGPVATGAGSVWVGDGGAAVARIDPRGPRLGDRIDVGNEPTAIAFGDNQVWVADDLDNSVSRVDATGGGAVTQTTPVGPAPTAIAVGFDAVWVAETQADQVVRLDPATGAATATIAVGERPTGLAVGPGGVWVANSLSQTVSRIDPETNEVDREVDLGQSPERLAVSDGRVWVSLVAPPSPPASAVDSDDESLRVLLSQDPGNLDPADYFFDPQRAYATCASLYSYPDEPAPEGSRLVPEAAAGPPEISDDGRTYTFTVRPGYEFSPPSGEPVTAAAFERQIQRVLDPRSKSYGANIVQDIVGAPDYAAGRGLAGVSAEGDELVVRLTRPAPDLVSRLASPWFCAVPPETPVTLTGSSLIPTAGPYYVESYDPGKSIVLRRNPNYDGPRPAELEQIDYELGVPPERAIERVESGTADYYSNRGLGQVIPAPDVARLDARYGPGSEAARAGAQRFFLTTDPAVHYLVFNTHRPPFDDARVRRAVNFAIDRRALAREPFPDVTGRPTDQFLPPGLAGFSDQANYPLGRPDVAHARQLAGDLDASAVLYTCNQPACDRLGQVVSRDLARIGIDVEVRQFAATELFDRVDARGEPFDLGQTNYFADYADPFNFVNFLFQPGLGLHGDLFEDPALTAEMERAATLTGDERYRAYAELDRELSADAAVGVPYASGTVANLFSARIGCQVDQPVYGIDLGRLCVR